MYEPEFVSLEAMQDKEHNMLDNVHDDTNGLHYGTCTDKFMEMNHDRMGEDSTDTTLREQRADKMLRNGQFPNYLQ